MSLSLVEECLPPPYLLTEHQPSEDHYALLELATRCLQKFSPHVALEPLAAKPWSGQWLHQPDALLLDIQGIAPLFGGEVEMLTAIHETFAAWQLMIHVGLAGSIGAAWALAHYRAKPGEILLLPDESGSEASPGTISKELGALPPEALRLPAEIIESLHRLGIHTIAELHKLPREGLLKRFDRVLLERLDQALGVRGETIEFIQEQPVPVASADLDCPTRDRDILERGVTSLLCDVVQRMGEQQQGILRLECRLTIEDRKEPFVMELGLFAPTAHAEHLGRLLASSLERRALPGPVVRIAIQATLLGTLRERQLGLLADMDRMHVAGGPLARFIDQLASRLGRTRILGVRLIADHQPEAAYELYPLAGQAHTSNVKAKKRRKPQKFVAEPPVALDEPIDQQQLLWWGPCAQEPLRRPLELYASPQSIELEWNPTESRLVRFRWHGNWFSVQRSWGPERIETGWWRGSSVRRNYYRVETTDGSWWWIFGCLNSSRWFLHGRFV